MKAASAKEALNLNNSEYFVTPYTLGLVLKSSNSGGWYRIGDVIISVNEENPSVKYGGKWELLCPGRTLVCVDTSQTEFDTVKKTGGDKTVTLNINQIPSHSHKIGSEGAINYGGFPMNFNPGHVNDNLNRNTYHFQLAHYNASNTGGGQAHSNLQPYIAVYMWVRIK